MLIDDLHEQLKNMIPDIQTITSFWNNAQLEKKFQELEATFSRRRILEKSQTSRNIKRTTTDSHIT